MNEVAPCDLRPALRKVGAGPQRSRDLDLVEALDAGKGVLTGQTPAAQVGALLIALRVKGECPAEIAGFALAIQENIVRPQALEGPVIDSAGSYDGRVRTAPVGVAAALLAGAVGVGSLFHGVAGLGRAGLGPRDLFEELSQTNPFPTSVRYVDQEEYSPSLVRLLPLRNQLGLRTVFNVAEKLTDLARGARRALLVGIYHGGYLEPVAEAASLAGVPRALVVQGLEGSEDPLITRDSRVCELRDGRVEGWQITLEAAGIHQYPASALSVQHRSEAFDRIRAALRGQPGPEREALVLSAAVRLYLADRVEEIAEGVALARRLVEEGVGEPWSR